MENSSDRIAPAPMSAACACGALKITSLGRPARIYACACVECQKRSGSSFTYTAQFNELEVTISGEYRTWRRHTDSGRWINLSFCPTCGVTLFGRVEAWPGIIGVAAGCFADPAFEKPETIYWASQRHAWFSLSEGIAALERQ
jgi:hypothetical protein